MRLFRMSSTFDDHEGDQANCRHGKREDGEQYRSHIRHHGLGSRILGPEHQIAAYQEEEVYQMGFGRACWSFASGHVGVLGTATGNYRDISQSEPAVNLFKRRRCWSS